MQILRGDDQVLTISDIGGTITEWQYRGKDIFYPRQEVVIDGKVHMRGGMHACFPNFGSVDARFGLPQHGPLRNRKADEMSNGEMIFRGRDLLGPAHTEMCEVKITIALEPKGFLYTLAARLLEPPQQDVFINWGLHPYFYTPEGTAMITVDAHQELLISKPQIDKEYVPVGHGVDVRIPGSKTTHLALSGDAWEGAVEPAVVLWRDMRSYVCVEPVLGFEEAYGTYSCLRLTQECLQLQCRFEIDV